MVTTNEMAAIMAAIGERQWRIIVTTEREFGEDWTTRTNWAVQCADNGGVNTLEEAADCLEESLSAGIGSAFLPTTLSDQIAERRIQLGNNIIRLMAGTWAGNDNRDGEDDITSSNAENLVRLSVTSYRHTTLRGKAVLSVGGAYYFHRAVYTSNVAPPETPNTGSGGTDPSGPVTFGDYEANWIAYLGYVPTWVHNYFYNVIGKQDEKWVG